MPKVMIICPTTNTSVWTGVTLTLEGFESGDFQGINLKSCSACKKEHTWNKTDANLDHSLITEAGEYLETEDGEKLE